MAPDLDPNSWDHSEMDKYGIGHVRDLQLFYKLFLIDPFKRKAVQLCPFAKVTVILDTLLLSMNVTMVNLTP